MFMSASSKIVDEFFYTLGRESSDSKTHWLCFASRKFCELHFKFNEKFKEVAVTLPTPNEFKSPFSSIYPSTSMHPCHLDILWFNGVREMFSKEIAR